MKVIVFGMLAEQIGSSEISVDKVDDTKMLKSVLIERYPSLKSVPFQMAVNANKISENIRLNENDVIALLPPFAGG